MIKQPTKDQCDAIVEQVFKPLPSEPPASSSARLALLVQKWRAAAASHAESTRGWAERSVKLKAMHVAKAEIYSHCADSLDEALKAANHASINGPHPIIHG